MASRITTMQEELDRLNVMRQAIRDWLTGAIKNLPANRNAVQVIGNPHCFVVMSSELSKHGNWTPEFYDFGYQYGKIIEILDAKPVEGVPDTLLTIINEARYRWQGETIRFHPDVITNLKTLLESEA